MDCWHCNTELIWGGDHTYEDYCMDGDGIVTNLSCPNDECGVDTVLVYCSLDDNESSEEE
tara:strand:+ start:652 stop:831 length:180 start_codon:yes stop_codon:yes gene_type:complete